MLRRKKIRVARIMRESWKKGFPPSQKTQKTKIRLWNERKAWYELDKKLCEDLREEKSSRVLGLVLEE